MTINSALIFYSSNAPETNTILHLIMIVAIDLFFQVLDFNIEGKNYNYHSLKDEKKINTN